MTELPKLPGGLLTADPIAVAKELWPDVYLYSKQREMIYSVWNNKYTFAVASNEMGKDFAASVVLVVGAITRTPFRFVTTSATDGHLSVLWGETHQRIASSRHKLLAKEGGPLLANQRELRRVLPDGKLCPLSYVKGMVAGPDSIAAMGGHHIAVTGDGIWRTLFMCDEASSVSSEYWKVAQPWMQRAFVFGNSWPCSNFFKEAFKGTPDRKDAGGDKPILSGPLKGSYYRKTFHITVEDSPNIRYARAQLAAGQEPDDAILCIGVKSWGKYQADLATMSEEVLRVAHRAEWDEGSGTKLFPRTWLDRAAVRADVLKEKKVIRKAMAIGVDPAEGGDFTAFCIVDQLGIIALYYEKTPNTAVIRLRIEQYMRQHGVPASRVCIDRGGGGKQVADEMRMRDMPIRTVSFGEKVARDIKEWGGKVFGFERKAERDEKMTYKNKRAMMYHRLRHMLDPHEDEHGNATRTDTFAIGGEFYGVRQELEPIPNTFDAEGVYYLIPKHKPTPTHKGPTLTELLGHSPDQADALVLACEAMSGADDEDGEFTVGDWKWD